MKRVLFWFSLYCIQRMIFIVHVHLLNGLCSSLTIFRLIFPSVLFGMNLDHLVNFASWCHSWWWTQLDKLLKWQSMHLVLHWYWNFVQGNVCVNLNQASIFLEWHWMSCGIMKKERFKMELCKIMKIGKSISIQYWNVQDIVNLMDKKSVGLTTSY